MREPRFELINGDVLKTSADVLALKYAQTYYGADRAASSRLVQAGEDPAVLTPDEGDFRLVSSRGVVAADRVLFMGVPELTDFDYREIRIFARRVLSALAAEAPDTKRLAVTLHGPGFGLDETEAFEAEVAGFLDGIRSGDAPPELERITIVERNLGRAERLEKVLAEILPHEKSSTDARIVRIEDAREERLRSAGYGSGAKKHVFVAMPFRDEMDDVYHYGIHGAVRDTGWICERADLSAFTGDVLQWVRTRIKSAALVVAELSETNPNVYLEVGFAWGCGVPTVLVAREDSQLPFDARGQRCLFYKRIKDLEEALRDELQALKLNRVV